MQNNTLPTLFIGQNLVRLSRVDSTNNYLKDLLSKSEPVPEGTVIMAEDQFAGRGQRENTWRAEPGKNLTFSLLLRPGFLPANKQFFLNIAVSLAVKEALAQYLPGGLSVKWPNDIYHHNHKLGGLLIENSIVGHAIKTAVIGIGINVNQQHFDMSLGGRATSVARILQADVNLTAIFTEICIRLEGLYFRLKAGDYTFLRESYVTSLYRMNELSAYRHGDERFEGKITGVSDEGQLQIDRQGVAHRFSFKEIEFLNS